MTGGAQHVNLSTGQWRAQHIESGGPGFVKSRNVLQCIFAHRKVDPEYVQYFSLSFVSAFSSFIQIFRQVSSSA